MVTEGLATCSGEGATTTENTMVMAKFVTEMSNGSYFPRRAEGNLYEQSTIIKGGQTSVFYNSIGPSCQNQVAADLGRQTDRKSINCTLAWSIFNKGSHISKLYPSDTV